MRILVVSGEELIILFPVCLKLNNGLTALLLFFIYFNCCAKQNVFITFERRMYMFCGYALFQDLRVLFVPWIFAMILATIVDVAHGVYLYGLDTVIMHTTHLNTITSIVIRSVPTVNIND